jgi:predicted PhzF superfamily epimerase YddE/YHI9
MDFPSDPPMETRTPEGLEEALGADCSQFYAAAYGVAILKDEATVRGLSPDIAAIERVTAAAGGGPGAVIVAAKADEGSRFDVVDRFFAPGFGIAEDPATGSAHCILAPLFGRLLGLERLQFHQAFPGRVADITTELDGDRVRLIGRGCVVAESRLRLHPTG